MEVAVFVDTRNIYSNVFRKFDRRKVDYRKYLAGIEGKIYQQNAYGGSKAGYSKPFIDCLRRTGYNVRFKTLEKNERVCWDTCMTLDIVNIINCVDVIVLGTSDPSFVPVAEWVTARGKQVITIACNIDPALREASTDCVEISENMLE